MTEPSTPAPNSGPAIANASDVDAALPHWPKATWPLTIAIFGWARLAAQAAEGSGYNLSASDLATGLRLSGHRVLYLASGRKYDLRPWARIAPTEAWRGIECFDLINSPNLSPAAYNIKQMQRELSCPSQSRLVLDWLRARQVQVVHIHSLEGYPLSLIREIRDMDGPGRGPGVIVTPHNYWYCCPQVDLMHRETSLCMDYEGGRRCESCLNPRSASLVRIKRRWGQSLERIVGPGLTHAGRLGAKAAGERMGELRGTRRTFLPNDLPATIDTGEPLDESVVVERDSLMVGPASMMVGRASSPPSGELTNGQDARSTQSENALVDTAPPHTRNGLIPQPTNPGPEDRIRRKLAASPIDQNERFLAATHHLQVIEGNIYAQRRREGIAALNAASLVTPPSDFVRRTMVAMGTDESRTRTVRLGQRHFDQMQRRARRSPFYRTRPWDPATATSPLRLAFFGTMRPSKGVDILADAITRLDTGIRQRCQFIFRCGGWDWPIRKKLIAYPEVSFFGPYDTVHLVAAGGEYDVGLLPHVWFENSPLVLLEHLHAGKFVIASRLGGPPEWIIEPNTPITPITPSTPNTPSSDAARIARENASAPRPYNGLMPPGGHPDDLAHAITRVATGDIPLPSPAEVHAITPNLQTYRGHVEELEQIYREAIEAKST